MGFASRKVQNSTTHGKVTLKHVCKHTHKGASIAHPATSTTQQQQLEDDMSAYTHLTRSYVLPTYVCFFGCAVNSCTLLKAHILFYRYPKKHT